MKRTLLILVALVAGAFLGAVTTSAWLQGQGRPNVIEPVPGELTSFREVVKRALPAVVSVRMKEEESSKTEDREAVADFGSGFLIEPSGWVLTVSHVVKGGKQATIKLADGREFLSTEIRVDGKSDLALIRIEGKDLPYLEFADSNRAEIGDRVLAIGAPFGLTGSVTAGIVSGKGRSLKVNLYEDFIQTDAAINPGNSGGPLIDLSGKVVGVNSAIKSHSGGFQGVGLAISSNLARDVADDLRTHGAVRRGYLGVHVKEIESGSSRQLVVTHVIAETPGARAGLRVGDVLFALAGRRVTNVRDLQNIVADQPIGKPVDLLIVRDEVTQKLSLVIEEQPADYGPRKK